MSARPGPASYSSSGQRLFKITKLRGTTLHIAEILWIRDFACDFISAGRALRLQSFCPVRRVGGASSAHGFDIVLVACY